MKTEYTNCKDCNKKQTIKYTWEKSIRCSRCLARFLQGSWIIINKK